MAKRKRKKKNQRHAFRTLLIMVVLLCAGLYLGASRIYMQRTSKSYPESLRETFRLGTAYVSNLFSPKANSVPVNTYRAEDYYSIGGLKHCAASEDSVAGIDVSVHQGDIDWQKVAEAGVEFAIIRVGYRGYTDGDIFYDSNFTTNIQGALRAGLKVGVYFFSQATSELEAREEARFVLSAIDGYTLDYPVFYDWEEVPAEARTDAISGEQMTDFALAFCEEIEGSGYQAGVYFNQSYGYSFFNLRRLRDYSFWLAEYNDAQSFAYAVELWQYDCEATLPGIATTVDLNLCYCTYPLASDAS